MGDQTDHQIEHQIELPSRRTFFGLLGAAIAAPAIVRYSSLMPVRRWQTLGEGPGGLLSIQQIINEAHRRLARLTYPIGCFPDPVVELGGQYHVDFLSRKADRLLPLEEYSEKLLSPAMNVLATVVKMAGKRILPVAPPSYRGDCVTLEKGNIGLRGADNYDIRMDEWTVRLDVLTD